MKILLFADNHFCSTSSIIRQRGKNFSTRLENQIATINWIERLSKEQNCDLVVCLGDFFNKPTLNDEEITSVKSIKWSDIFHYFIVGNHESSINDLGYNSTKALESANREIISKPHKMKLNSCGDELCFLPYITESDRKSLSDYFDGCSGKRIILSHNDIEGIQMGPVITKSGFNIDEIEKCCDLFINGHLHNGSKFCRNGINLGNCTGQNFSENAFLYKHNVAILDTDTLELVYYENPFAFNFYKIDIAEESDIKKVDNVKYNSIISFKCNESLVNKLKSSLQKYENDYKEIDSDDCTIKLPKILNYRITSVVNNVEKDTYSNIEDLSIDHLAKFVDFCKERIGSFDVVLEELNEVCK